MRMRPSQKVKMWLYELAICALALISAGAEQDVQLEIPQGHLKGLRTETIFHNKPYYSFTGIPYAKPNVGEHKFRIPEPADSWEGVYDATKNRQPCPFYCMIKKGLIGDEDCLYLNVYTPVLDKEAHKAVMVWFHPGGWNSGFGDNGLFAPDFLVEQDVVLVTLNYRLGALGFLNTGDASAPGNAGMKDQVMALNWVKDNIHFFGGSPSRVTIFGDSSGGGSVQYHMISPMSEGLFSSAIQQSGSAVNPWSVSYNPKELAFMLGEALGITTTDSAELVKKLSEFHVKDIIAASNEIMKSQNTVNGRMHAFVPSVEADLGQDIFLPADPWTLLKSGRLADVPLMAGITANEAVPFGQLMIGNIELLNDQPEKFLPCDLNVTDSDKKRELGESLRKFYFGDKRASMETTNEFTTMLSDLIFDYGVCLSLQIVNARNSAPIYEYLFSYEAPFGFMKSLFGIQEGVSHGDEMGYLFYSNIFKNMPEPGSASEKVTEIMTRLWANFAKDNNPTSKMDEFITVNWDPKGSEDNYMNINQELKMEKNLFKDRMDFWRGLYKDTLDKYA